MLSGNLELFALADVLRFVARSGATGAVNIQSGYQIKGNVKAGTTVSLGGSARVWGSVSAAHSQSGVTSQPARGARRRTRV